MSVAERPRLTPNSSYVESPRLAYLDGIRGTAALYVALHHAALMIPAQGLTGPAVAVRFLLRHGHSAVAIFIVLSGYCLMLPLAAAPSGRSRDGLCAFFQRRGRRILPPYFAALVLCWLLIALVPDLQAPARTPWDRALPASGRGVVLSHLLLLHNLSADWMFKIDPPMWSVATEWQIYGFFPVLVALWRRSGIVAAIAAGFSLGYAVAALAGPTGSQALRELCPWFAGLFALGMAAALATHGEHSLRPARARPMEAVILVVLALIAAGIALAGTDNRNFMIVDPVVGGVTAALLVRWTRRAEPGSTKPRLPLLRLLEGQWAGRLGTFSYSLYLIHYPLLALVDAILRRWSLGPEPRFWLLLVGATPLILLAASLFHRCFERPFHTPRRRSIGSKPQVRERHVSQIKAQPTANRAMPG